MSFDDFDFDNYAKLLQGVENPGGGLATKNPLSSAAGLYQFLEPTWAGLMQRYPKLGLTPEGRTNSATQQNLALRAYTMETLKQLQAAGMPINFTNAYILHLLGPTGGIRFLRGLGVDPSSTVTRYTDPPAYRSNRVFFDEKGVPRTMQRAYEDIQRRFVPSLGQVVAKAS